MLASVFSSRGSRETGGRRSAFRSPTGFEIHAVREYVPGDPVRAVHWPSTAHRGRLMVRELDDAPREDVTVVLDLDPEGVVGPPGRSSFDAVVRAAGALALAHVLRGRCVAITGTSPSSSPVRVATSGRDWEAVLDMLAAAEPVPGATVDRALHAPASPVAGAHELVVVTARPGRAVEALLELQLAGRSVSLVAVAAETYAGRARRTTTPRCCARPRAGSPSRSSRRMSRSRSHSPTGLWEPQVLDGWQRRRARGRASGPRGRRRVGVAAERRCGRPVRGGRRAVARRRAARVVPPAGAAGRRDRSSA